MIITVVFVGTILQGVYGWDYFGPKGVDTWPKQNAVCGGKRQSPINIKTHKAKYDASLSKFTYTGYDDVSVYYVMENNNRTVGTRIKGQVEVTGSGLLGNYVATQVYFHWGAENIRGSDHTFDGHKFPMEMHIVHYNKKYGNLTSALKHEDGVAVLGFVMELGKDDNKGLKQFTDLLHYITKNGSIKDAGPFALNTLLPPDFSAFYRYHGSLTTPNCNEVVTWTIFRDTIKFSQAQLDEFRKLQSSEVNPATGTRNMGDNYRPPQPLNGRTVTTNVNDQKSPNGQHDRGGKGTTTTAVAIVVAVVFVCISVALCIMVKKYWERRQRSSLLVDSVDSSEVHIAF